MGWARWSRSYDAKETHQKVAASAGWGWGVSHGEHILPFPSGKGAPGLSSGDSAQDPGTVCAQILGEIGRSKLQMVSERPQKFLQSRRSP